MVIVKMLEHVERYKDYLRYEKNYSDYTINSYSMDILEFYEYLKRENIEYRSVEYSQAKRLFHHYPSRQQNGKSGVSDKICRSDFLRNGCNR